MSAVKKGRATSVTTAPTTAETTSMPSTASSPVARKGTKQTAADAGLTSPSAAAARAKRTRVEAKHEPEDWDESEEVSSPPSSSATTATATAAGSGTMKYRKYRERQRNKYNNMEVELDELRQECAELHRRESKLLYLLLMSGKRDIDTTRLSKERDEMQLRLAMEMRYSRALAKIVGQAVPQSIQPEVVLPSDDMERISSSMSQGSQPAVAANGLSHATNQQSPMQSAAANASQAMPPPPTRAPSHLMPGPSNSMQFMNFSASGRNSMYNSSHNALSFSMLGDQGAGDFMFLDKVLAESNFGAARDQFLESLMADDKRNGGAAAGASGNNSTGVFSFRSGSETASQTRDVNAMLADSEAEAIAAMALTTVGVLSPTKQAISNDNGSSASSTSSSTSNNGGLVAATGGLKSAEPTRSSVTIEAPTGEFVIVSSAAPIPCTTSTKAATVDTAAIPPPPLEAENGFSSRFKASKAKQQQHPLGTPTLSGLMCAETLPSSPNPQK